MNHLTIDKCLKRIKESGFKKLILTEDEFLEFFQLIDKEDRLKLSLRNFDVNTYHDIKVVVKK